MVSKVTHLVTGGKGLLKKRKKTRSSLITMGRLLHGQQWPLRLGKKENKPISEDGRGINSKKEIDLEYPSTQEKYPDPIKGDHPRMGVFPSGEAYKVKNFNGRGDQISKEQRGCKGGNSHPEVGRWG